MNVTATMKWLRILGVILITVSLIHAFVVKRDLSQNSLPGETGIRHHIEKRQSTVAGTGGNQNNLPPTQVQAIPSIQNGNVQDNQLQANPPISQNNLPLAQVQAKPSIQNNNIQNSQLQANAPIPQTIQNVRMPPNSQQPSQINNRPTGKTDQLGQKTTFGVGESGSSHLTSSQDVKPTVKAVITGNEPGNHLDPGTSVSKVDNIDQSSPKTTEIGSNENTPNEEKSTPLGESSDDKDDVSYYSSILKDLFTSDYDYNNFLSHNAYDSESPYESMGSSWYPYLGDSSFTDELQEADEYGTEIKGTQPIGPENYNNFIQRNGLPKPSSTKRTKQSSGSSYFLHFILLAAVVFIIVYLIFRNRRSSSVQLVSVSPGEDKNWNQDYSAQIDARAKELEPMLIEAAKMAGTDEDATN